MTWVLTPEGLSRPSGDGTILEASCPWGNFWMSLVYTQRFLPAVSFQVMHKCGRCMMVIFFDCYLFLRIRSQIWIFF